MKHPSSLTVSAPRSGLPRRARPKNHYLAALTGGLALLAGSVRALAAPAPAFPLEPAFELAADARPEPVPLRWAGGWMLAKVMINGADAGWFTIATGLNWSCIDPQVAARLKLQEGQLGEGAGFPTRLQGSPRGGDQGEHAAVGS